MVWRKIEFPLVPFGLFWPAACHFTFTAGMETSAEAWGSPRPHPSSLTPSTHARHCAPQNRYLQRHNVPWKRSLPSLILFGVIWHSHRISPTFFRYCFESESEMLKRTDLKRVQIISMLIKCFPILELHKWHLGGWGLCWQPAVPTEGEDLYRQRSACRGDTKVKRRDVEWLEIIDILTWRLQMAPWQMGVFVREEKWQLGSISAVFPHQLCWRAVTFHRSQGSPRTLINYLAAIVY